MRLSQAKVSTISFMLALLASLALFGGIAYMLISDFMSPDTPVGPVEDPGQHEQNPGSDDPIVDPGVMDNIKGESFKVLLAGYDVLGDGFDAMAVVEVSKETQKVTVYPVNTDVLVYVGHGNTNSLNVRVGDLIKYKDMQYVLDKVNATTGLKIDYYITFTAKGFIKAFDTFNESGDYVYKVPKNMEHLYFEPTVDPFPEEPLPDDPEGLLPEDEREDFEQRVDLTMYNISFTKGDSLTSGLDIYNMLRYKGDSAADRADRQTTFIRDIMEKIIPARFKEGNSAAVTDMIKALLRLGEDIQTNITPDVFIIETYDLIAEIPNFMVETVKKYLNALTNFK